MPRFNLELSLIAGVEAATVLPERSFGNFPVPASTPAIKDNSRLKRGIDTSA